MLVTCNSCQKKFNVPDSAITESGRLLQCGSCGNKWTQYPIKLASKSPEKETLIQKTKKTMPKKKKAKKRGDVNLYSEEYLKKKHGIKIIDPSSAPIIKKKQSFSKKRSFGFYNYILTSFVFLITLTGILNLTQEIIILEYPFLEIYINYLFETLNNLKLIFFDLIR